MKLKKLPFNIGVLIIPIIALLLSYLQWKLYNTQIQYTVDDMSTDLWEQRGSESDFYSSMGEIIVDDKGYVYEKETFEQK